MARGGIQVHLLHLQVHIRPLLLSLRDLLRPIANISKDRCGTDATYKVAEDVEELDEVVKHFGLLSTALLSLHREVVAPKTTRFVYVFERRVPTGRCRSSEGRRTRTYRLATFVRLPLVYVMTTKEFVSTLSH